MTDARGVVAELSWSEVRRARIDGSEPILPFEELLDAWPDLRINVDPKHDAAVAPLLALIAARGAADRVCVGSFDSSRVRAARDAFGEAGCTALTRVEVARLWLKSRSAIASTAGRFRPTAPHGTARGGRCAQVPTRLGPVALVDRRFIERAHRSGLPVHVWTVDHVNEMRRLLDLGVDGLMSDQPAVLRSVLESRGQWVEVRPAPPPAGTIHR